MEIKEVVIHNFKSIAQDCSLGLEKRVTAIVGASESGKTNILEALNKFFIQKAFDKPDICTFAETHIENDSYMVSVTFKLEDSDDREEISRVDERIVEAGKFILRKCRNGQFVLEETGLGKRKPTEPQPPEQLYKLHEQIKQQIETTVNQLEEYLSTIPDDNPARQDIKTHVAELGNFASTDDFSPKLKEVEEKEFLKDGSYIPEVIKSIIKDLENIPDEITNGLDEIRKQLEEAISLSYEIPGIDTNKLLELCPRVVYMKDADIQLLPDSVPISGLEAHDKKAVLYEPLLGIANLTVENLRETEQTTKDRNLRIGSKNVSGFLKLWSQEKLEAIFSVDKNDNLYFNIQGKEGHFGKLSDRSEGFRWFLSFCLTHGLPQDSSKGAILLLDEPGLHLHASAQKDLLEQFENVSQFNQIIYTTHSPFMINKNYPERIRAVFKEEAPKGTFIDNKAYRATKGGCYEPVRTSIGITLGNSLFIGGSNLIVEGIADQIILTAFSRYLARQNKKAFINLQDVCITPAGGVENVPYFAYLCNIEDMKPIVLLDNDAGGNTAYSRIEKEKVILTDRVIRVRDAVSKKAETILEIEDLIDHKYYHGAVLKAYKELPGIKFSNNLPETYEEVSQKQQTKQRTSNKSPNVDTAEQQASTEGNSGKRVVERSSQPRGTTKVYSEFFESKKWGGFDKVLVARTISSKIDDDESPEDATISNFAKLFGKINNKLS